MAKKKAVVSAAVTTKHLDKAHLGRGQRILLWIRFHLTSLITWGCLISAGVLWVLAMAEPVWHWETGDIEIRVRFDGYFTESSRNGRTFVTIAEFTDNEVAIRAYITMSFVLIVLGWLTVLYLIYIMGSQKPSANLMGMHLRSHNGVRKFFSMVAIIFGTAGVTVLHGFPAALNNAADNSDSDDTFFFGCQARDNLWCERLTGEETITVNNNSVKYEWGYDNGGIYAIVGLALVYVSGLMSILVLYEERAHAAKEQQWRLKKAQHHADAESRQLDPVAQAAQQTHMEQAAKAAGKDVPHK